MTKSQRTRKEQSYVRLNLVPNTRILSAEDVSSPDKGNQFEDAVGHNNTASLHLVLQHTLTHELSENTYDVIICGTGYERSSWARLLESSEIGKHFGLGASSNTMVELVPSVAGPEAEVRDNNPGLNVEVGSPGQAPYSATSGTSTPLTSPVHSPSLSCSQLLTPSRNAKLHISRNYRLLPITSGDGSASFLPKIYLQGCTESTHGLSESLLSILGVRAGLVVDDLLSQNL